MQNNTPFTLSIQSDIQIDVCLSSGGKEFLRLGLAPSEVAHNPVAQALMHFIQGLGATCNPEEDANLEVGPASAAAVQDPKSQLLAVLQDRSKYSRRTFPGLAKATGLPPSDLSFAVQSCLADGTVIEGWGRDGVQYFSAGEKASAAQAVPGEIAATTGPVFSFMQSAKADLLEVLGDRSKYSRRTKEGLRKALSAYSDEVFSKALEQCLLDGSVHKYEGIRATYFFTEVESSASSDSETYDLFDAVTYPEAAKFVYAFLRDKSKYQRRSFEAIEKALGADDARLIGSNGTGLDLVLGEMADEGLIEIVGDFYEAL